MTKHNKDRTNTAAWSKSRARWELSVQRDGVRRKFTCTTPGRNGQRECNRKADDWLSGAAGSRRNRLGVSEAVNLYRQHIANLWAARRGVDRSPDAPITGKDLGTDRPMFSLLDTWTTDISTRWVDKVGDFEVQTILDRAFAHLSKFFTKTPKKAREYSPAFFNARNALFDKTAPALWCPDGF